MAVELLPRELVDRLHGEDCECPVHRPDLQPPADSQPCPRKPEQVPLL